MHIFRLSIARVKNNLLPYVILQAMSQFSCKLCIRGHLKSTFVEEGRVGEGKSLKSEQKQTGVGGPSIHVRFFFKKMLRSSK